MKKKVVSLSKLSLNKETIGSLSADKVIGGISELASCICTAIQEQASCGIPCSRITCGREATQCTPCQSGGCPSLDTHCAGCGIGG
ncbi:class I lanthipeptide [Taibaiella koreensis]|uniref:class I lanthipeptide n=1 Tax=Taibaiella koreensis TaxID=1268548 RepID=UPI0013C2E64B|nr:class I lanthipeptide [Taibaiella koreensis]